MTTEQTVAKYKSFLLRLWQEDRTATPPIWRGEIESIQTGQKWEFDSPELITVILQTRILAAPTNDTDEKND